jgi:hypothetical protein
MQRHTNLQRSYRSRIATCLVACAGIVVCLDSAFAQSADQVTIDARRCTEIESPDERLACFEAEVDAARERSEAVPQASNSAAGTPPQPSQPPTRTVDLTRVRDADERAAEQTEWVGNITSLSQRTPNRYVITLDSGDVWLQTVAERYPLRVGQRVRVYATRWGSNQRLEADGVNGFIQVERVR